MTQPNPRTTPIYGWPTPSPGQADDVPAVMQDLAEAIEGTVAGQFDALDARVSDLESAVACRAGRTSTQSIPNNSDTEIELQTFGYSHGGFSLSSGRIVVPVAGIYRVSGGIRWTGQTGPWRRCQIRYWPGGSTPSVIAGNAHAINSSISHPTAATTEFEASAGDHFSVQGRQTSGGALDAMADADTFLAVSLVVRL